MMKMDFIRELGERLTRLSDIIDSQQLIEVTNGYWVGVLEGTTV